MTRRTLLFDLDGTLTDPKDGIVRCIRFALDRLHVEYAESDSLEWCIGPPLHESFAKILGDGRSALVPRAVALYRERFGAVGLFENRPYDGIGTGLDALGASFTLRVATSKPTVFATRILEHFGLDRHFASIHGSELDGTRTNKGELIRYILDTHRIAPEAALMIGDREHDIRGAQVNGMRGIGVLWGYGSEQELRTAGAMAIAATPGELPALAAQWAE